MTAVPIKRAVIPAAGRGTRLMPLTGALPKALMPLAGRPALHYLLDELIAAGIAEACVIRAPDDAIPAHFSSPDRLGADCPPAVAAEIAGFGRRLDLRFVEGAADAPLWSLGRVRGFVGAEPFVVALPDEIVAGDGGLLIDLIDVAAALGATTVALRAAAPGAARIERLLGPIVRPGEEPAAAGPKARMIGRFVLGPRLLDRAGGQPTLPDLLSAEAQRGGVVGLRHDGPYWDIGTVAGYVRAFVELAER